MCVEFSAPGPAVTIATPGTPVSLEMASAAKTVVASSRTSTTLMPTASHPTRIGAMWPPVKVNTKRTPCSRQAWAASKPPYCTEAAGPVSAAEEDDAAVSRAMSAVDSAAGASCATIACARRSALHWEDWSALMLQESVVGLCVSARSSPMQGEPACQSVCPSLRPSACHWCDDGDAPRPQCG